MPYIVPLCHFAQIDLGLNQPNVENVEPLWEEFSFEDLSKDTGTEEINPCDNPLEGTHLLLPRIDLELIPKDGTKLGNDVLEEQIVPFRMVENLYALLAANHTNSGLTYIFPGL